MNNTGNKNKITCHKRKTFPFKPKTAIRHVRIPLIAKLNRE